MLRLVLELVVDFFNIFKFSVVFGDPTPVTTATTLVNTVTGSLQLRLMSLANVPTPTTTFTKTLATKLLTSFVGRGGKCPEVSLAIPSVIVVIPKLCLCQTVCGFNVVTLSSTIS